MKHNQEVKQMKRPLMALLTLGLGIGFVFAVPTAVVHASGAPSVPRW
jgi:hypothetical protein